MRHARLIQAAEWDAITDVTRVAAAARTAQQAAADYAAVLAGVAAALIHASLPAAHTLMFDIDVRDGVTDITLLTVRDLTGALLWHGEDFYQPTPDEITAGVAVLDAGVVEAVTTTIQEAYDAGRGVFTTVTAGPADLLGMNLLELNILAALRHDPTRTADTAPDTEPVSINLDLLAAVLARETSVMDPDDVDALMAVVRAAAASDHAHRPAR
ncbi:MAG TPA: hypothetical protein VK453_11860 [Micromonosporaceae bacterium]|nr:hypothetical protein [Micromonosporaceae bacterium]